MNRTLNILTLISPFVAMLLLNQTDTLANSKKPSMDPAYPESRPNQSSDQAISKSDLNKPEFGGTPSNKIIVEDSESDIEEDSDENDDIRDFIEDNFPTDTGIFNFGMLPDRWKVIPA